MNKEAQRELASVDYWNKRYSEDLGIDKKDDEDQYEWLKTFKKLRQFLERHLPSPLDHPRILQLGCGINTMTADLYRLGYRDQVSVDFSSVAIEAMQTKYASLTLDWKVMDVRNLRFPNSTFDIAIDKSTLDAMLHGSLWDPEDDVKESTTAYVDEVARVLKPKGKWLCVTYRQPHFLTPLLQRKDKWELHVETLEDTPGAFEYFGFVMSRRIK